MKDKTEARIQQECVMWFRNNYCLSFHDPKCLIFSIPNESENMKDTINKIAIGLLKGASDLVVIMKNLIIFVEVKTEIGVQSKEQIGFENDIKNLGFEYYLVRSLEEFKQMIEYKNGGNCGNPDIYHV